MAPRALALSLALALALSALALADGTTAPPTVQTTSGPITGIATSDGGAAFLGVPFAANPPVRWGPPRPPQPWTAPLNASSYGAGCVTFMTGGGPADSAQGEACLTVNVWVPPNRTEGTPMIVWIHGGGFVGGDGSGDFQTYSKGTGAVIVSVNYRLGSLGFFALEGMGPAYPTPSDPDAACANVGLLDQQLALLWAKANANAFGCDPDHILLTGESAGGSSVLFQLTLNGSYPAYRAAMAQSPGSPVNTLAEGHATAAAIALHLGCGPAGGYVAQLACLRAVPAASVVSAAVAVAKTNDLPLTLGPVVDGALVTASPAAKMLAGEFHLDASIFVTQCLFEGDSLLDGFTHSIELNASAAAAALTQFGISVGFDDVTIASVGAAYDALSQRDGYWNGSSRIWGDGLIVCASSWAARGAVAHGRRPVHRFLFNTTFPGQTAGRSTHGTDLGVLFSGAAPIVAHTFWAWLANVATTGDPNVGPAPVETRWPAYTGPGTAPSILVANELGIYSSVESWQEEFCDKLWFDILP